MRGVMVTSEVTQLDCSACGGAVPSRRTMATPLMGRRLRESMASARSVMPNQNPFRTQSIIYFSLRLNTSDGEKSCVAGTPQADTWQQAHYCVNEPHDYDSSL